MQRVRARLWSANRPLLSSRGEPRQPRSSRPRPAARYLPMPVMMQVRDRGNLSALAALLLFTSPCLPSPRCIPGDRLQPLASWQLTAETPVPVVARSSTSHPHPLSVPCAHPRSKFGPNSFSSSSRLLLRLWRSVFGGKSNPEASRGAAEGRFECRGGRSASVFLPANNGMKRSSTERTVVFCGSLWSVSRRDVLRLDDPDLFLEKLWAMWHV